MAINETSNDVESDGATAVGQAVDVNSENDGPEEESLQNQQQLSSPTTGIANAVTSTPVITNKPFFTPVQVMCMLTYFSSQYNIINIGLVIPILKLEFSSYTEEDISAVASSLFYGTMVGQLLGGYLGDTRLGRLGALRLVMLIQIIAAIGSSFVGVAGGSSSKDLSVYTTLSIWRFFLGIGAGGVYPLAACLSAEQNENDGNDGDERPIDTNNDDNDNNNNNTATTATATLVEVESHEQQVQKMKRVVTTFSMQGIGFIAVPIITVPLLHILGEDQVSLTWRIVLGVGAIPGFILLLMVWRLSSRTTAYTSLVGNTSEEEDNDLALAVEEVSDPVVADSSQQQQQQQQGIISAVMSSGNLSNGLLTADDTFEYEDDDNDDTEPPPTNVTQRRQQHVGLWDAIRAEKNLVGKLLGTAGSWFLMDVVFFGNTLFQPIVMEAVFGKPSSANTDDDNYKVLVKATTDSLILTSMALPGYAVIWLLIGKRTCYCITQTPRYIQLQGFAAWSILYAIIGISWNSLTSSPSILVILYGLTFFFANYGPNTTTFILPSLVYSHDCRSTLNGVCAAFAKIGAVFAATVFSPATDLLGADIVMLMCAAISIVGYALTHCFVRIPGTTITNEEH